MQSEAGFESLFWGRTDYQDMAWRTSAAGKAKNQWPEWVWQGSQSLGSSAEIFAGQLVSDLARFHRAFSRVFGRCSWLIFAHEGLRS